MNILMVLEGEYPSDNRVEKEVNSLINSGFNVDIACCTRKGLKKQEMVEGSMVYRKHISNFMSNKLSAVTLILPFYFWFWKKFIQSLFNSKKYDVIHVHDLPLSKVGYFFKKKYNVKLVCDQHEYYSNWIVHTNHYNRGIGKIINWLSDWRAYERKYLHKADLVITIEEPLRKCYLDEVGLPGEKVILVPNTPTLDIFNENNVDEKIVDQYKNNFMIFYAGGIDKLRGLDLVIESLKILRNEVPSVKFVVAGRQARGFDIEYIARRHHVLNHVDFIGWIDIEKIPSYIAASKIGVFTPPGNRDEIHNTIATKIYQYMAMDTPVIVSDVKLMKEFVENNEIGVAVKNSEEFASVVQKWSTDSELYIKMKDNCKRIKKQYVWDHTIKQLVDFYKSID
ncbi:MAG: glycosyltransferase family 4 protein [bacterium]